MNISNLSKRLTFGTLFAAIVLASTPNVARADDPFLKAFKKENIFRASNCVYGILALAGLPFFLVNCKEPDPDFEKNHEFDKDKLKDAAKHGKVSTFLKQVWLAFDRYVIGQTMRSSSLKPDPVDGRLYWKKKSLPFGVYGILSCYFKPVLETGKQLGMVYAGWKILNNIDSFFDKPTKPTEVKVVNTVQTEKAATNL